MRLSRQLFTDLFFLFVLFISSGATEAFTQSGKGPDAQGSPIMKVLWACVYLGVLIALIPRYSQLIRVMRSNLSFVLLLVLAIISVRWSVDPSTTLSKSLPLFFSALIGIDFALRYSIRDQLRLIWMVLAVVMVLGIVAQVVFPGFVPDVDLDAGSSWNGIVTTKNAWARLVVLTGIVIMSRRQPTRRSTLATVILMCMVMALLVASQSAGGLLIMVIMLFMFFAFKALHWQRRPLIVLATSAAIALAVFASYALSNLDRLTGLLGKDATLTGRVPIWRESLIYIGKQPILGYGYSAFWSQTSRPGRLIREAIHWDTLPHAHNGYIDLTLALGCVGLFLYLAAFFVGAWRGALLIRRRGVSEAAWPLAFLCVICFYQLDEASIVSANQLIWILFAAVLVSLSMRHEEVEQVHEDAEIEMREPAFLVGS